MRADAVGLFWEDIPEKKGKRNRILIRPPVPDTGWKPPRSLPDLSSAVLISIDLETYDPELIEHGPGWARGKGHIVGVAIGAMDSNRNFGRWYFPIRHEDEPEHNLDPDKVLCWCRHVLGTKTPKIGANITYDIGWFREEGVEVAGPLYDVQFMEALLDEAAPVALEEMAQKYLGEGKESNLLYEWSSRYFGGKANGKQRANIYRSPPRLVGPYAESDADLPLRLFVHLWNRIVQEGLLEVFDMECRLIRLNVDMRYRGVAVDIPKAEALRQELSDELPGIYRRLSEVTRTDINPENFGEKFTLSKAFDNIGLAYPKTEKGNPSFRKEFLDNLEHPVGELIRDIREREKLIGTFIDSYILNSHVDGVVYGQFHQLRGEGGGTRSGRFSSSTPNLQNIPIRTELGNRIRQIFVAQLAGKWRKYDYSQIEYRMLLHFATGAGADEIRAYFNAHPETDYHNMVINLIKQATGVSVDRKPAKNINFGLIYGMGIAKLTRSLGLSPAEGKALFAAYHKGVPFALDTMEATSKEANALGYITTIMGRKSRFDLWEPMGRTYDIALPYEKALMKYGAVQRAYLHKALNRRLQGSAADLMKKAMVLAYEAGVFDATGMPSLTVHDELDFDDPDTPESRDGFRELHWYMENAAKLKIPVKVDLEIGPNWGQVVEV